MNPSEVNGDRSARAMTGAHGHLSVRRAVAAVVAAAVLVQNVACTRFPPRPDERTCAEEKAEILSRSKDNAEHAIFFNVTADGQWRCAAFVPQGYYMAKVLVTWPDGSTKNVWVTQPDRSTKKLSRAVFQAFPEKQYSVLAHEEGVGRVLAVATLVEADPLGTGTSTSIVDVCGGHLGIVLFPICLPLFVVMTAAAIIASPFIIAYAITKGIQGPDPDRRIWIEDNSGLSVAGIAPPDIVPAPPPSSPTP